MIMIDSSVLLDLYDQNSEWHLWSMSNLTQAANKWELVINPIIYAEASVKFASPEKFDAAFPAETFLRHPLPFSAAFLAAKAHLEYRRRGGVRAATLPDFFIGSHAAIAGYKLLTRDPRRFKRYFPSVDLISP